MFLKRLLIDNINGEIRKIEFRKGLNLIIDETPDSDATKQSTGNNVGKTTVLRLIDFCLGAKGESIYKDTEFSRQPNTTIEDFLIDTEVMVTLELAHDLDAATPDIIIKRNFLKRKKKIQSINGESHIDSKDFDLKLKKLIYSSEVEKPSFRQIISKNIRIEKDRMDKILKVLGSFVRNEDYEALYLFWLGINTDRAEEKRKLSEQKKKEENFQKRLKKEGELPLIEQKLSFHNGKIQQLESSKNSFNLNENYSQDITELNGVKSDLNSTSSRISKLEIRKELIIESRDDLQKEISNINIDQIRNLYHKANSLIPNLQVSFEDTLKFHNDLIAEKLEYVTKELPEIEAELTGVRLKFERLQASEVFLTQKLQKSGLAEDLEKIISELSSHYERKGSLEEQKRLWVESIDKQNATILELELINEDINSNEALINSRITQFNKFFTRLSEKLYGENYILSQSPNKTGYDLNVTNLEGNPSTGKKKGQIAAFDFAYIQFADELGIKTLHFILHDQLENVHDNQLVTLIEVAESLNVQYVVPILKDKIPSQINSKSYEILSLSQDQKLFKI